MLFQLTEDTRHGVVGTRAQLHVVEAHKGVQDHVQTPHLNMAEPHARDPLLVSKTVTLITALVSGY